MATAQIGTSGAIGPGKALHRLQGDRIEACAAVIDMIDDRAAHPRIPESQEMIGHARRRVVRLGAEELADLIGHFDEFVDLIMRHELKPVRECVLDG